MAQKNNMQAWQISSYLSGGNAEYLEALYESFLKDPQSVDKEWHAYFTGLGDGTDVSHEDLRQQFRYAAKLSAQVMPASEDIAHARKEAAVSQLINDYRAYGHQSADLDPLGLTKRPAMPALELSHHGLSDADLDTNFHAAHKIGMPNASLRELIAALKETYCESIGVEYMHVANEEERAWLKKRIEPQRNKPQFSVDEKKHILHELIAADSLEKYLGNKYVGQKRFSLEGGDAFIASLDRIVQAAGEQGVKEAVISMAHRGRLNVLMNILGKSSQDLFNEFEGKLEDEVTRSGDVKYHLGFSSNVETAGGITHLSLAFNPSHLEIAGPVVEGSVRARQRRRNDKDCVQVLPVLVHGDAAFAGQGVVMETFSFSQARGFCTGGTIHIVINNQIGFTTSNPLDARSTLYCTDIGKMIQAPIFHVNGNNPEAVCFATQIALDYRMKFHKDVILDIVCYRRHGHNEADEPMMTQPVMYQIIKKLPPPYRFYADRLIAEKVITEDDVKKKLDAYRTALDAGHTLVKTVDTLPDKLYTVDWTPYLKNTDLSLAVKTSVDKTTLQALGKRLQVLPEKFVLQRQVQKVMEARAKMVAEEQPLDWGCAETLAYATILNEGHPVRISGQDSGRGTFAHRHAELHNQEGGGSYFPLSHLGENQGKFICIDSVLSEEAVMAFEYGYATAEPSALVIWEGQFGDFANGAQVVIDQFLSSGEQKWDRFCGLTLLLPHGYEGMGPEHSSARLERYLQLCAQKNMSVCVPTTPAQIFHMLRRQVVRPIRKPLIVMSPKSLLRHKMAVSDLSELYNGELQLIIPEIDELNAVEVKKVVLCSGKVYYDLLDKRRNDKLIDVAIVRIEQLYPFPREELLVELAKYKNAKTVVWCQEEPMNQGAWYQISFHLRACTVEKGRELDYAGRSASAAPAAGSAKRHAAEQKALVAAALA